MLFVRLLPTSTIGHLPSKLGGAKYCRVNHELLRALPPPLIDGSVPSQTTMSPLANKRYTHRDSIYYFGMRTILITMVLALMLFMLFGSTSMLHSSI